MQSYLQSLAQVFAQQVGADFSKYTFVFPNHRVGLFFRKYLLQATNRTTLLPQMLTINECFASLTHITVPDQLTLLLRLYRLYVQQRPDAESLEQFLHWGKMMLADFSEIDNHLIQDVRSLYALIKDMRDIDTHFAYLNEKQLAAIKRFWGEFHKSATSNHNSHMHTQFLRTWQLLYPLYQALREDLLKDNIAYEGLLHREVIEHWQDIPTERFNLHYVFIGFNAMTESERQLMLHLQEMDRADFYFDYNHDFLSDEHNVATRFMHDNTLLFRSKYSLPTTPTTLSNKNIHLITTTASITQAHQVHEILVQEIGRVQDWSRTAVVLPNEEMLIPILHSIPTHIDKVNVTMGYPLTADPIYHLVASPDQDNSTTLAEPLDFIAHMRSKVADFYSTDNQPEATDQANNNLSTQLIIQALDRIQRAIHNYPDIIFTNYTVQQLLKMLTADVTIPYKGEPLEGLQIMGVLETRALDFDNIIITDFNDDIYPGHSRNNSFIPYSLRHGFDLPTVERQDAIFAYNFYRMLAHAKNVWFIANTHADDQHTGELSRYYYQLLWQYQLPIQRTTIVDKLSSTNTQRMPIAKSPRVLQLLSKYYTSTSEKGNISASALGEYLRCQKSFYYKYLEEIREPEEDNSITINSMTIGNVLHAIMQHLYMPFEGKTVQRADIQDLMDNVNNDQYWHALEALKDLNGDELAERTILSFVNNTLYHDYLQAPFEYLASEQSAHKHIHLSKYNQDIAVYGKIDRIDIQDGKLRIIDYKTGSATLKYPGMPKVFGLDDKNEAQTPTLRNQGNKYILQTLLYCWLLEDAPLLQSIHSSRPIPVAPHIFPVRQLNDETIVTCLTDKNGDSIDYNDTIAEEFLSELTHLLDEMFDPALPFQPVANTSLCKDCFLNQICLLTKSE